MRKCYLCWARNAHRTSTNNVFITLSRVCWYFFVFQACMALLEGVLVCCFFWESCWIFCIMQIFSGPCWHDRLVILRRHKFWWWFIKWKLLDKWYLSWSSMCADYLFWIFISFHFPRMGIWSPKWKTNQSIEQTIGLFPTRNIKKKWKQHWYEYGSHSPWIFNIN